MPIHQKLDEIGVTHYIKNGTFDAKIYRHWLVTTFQLLTGYQRLLDSTPGIDDQLLQLSPLSLAIDEIMSDISDLESDIEFPQPLQFQPLDNPKLAIVPIYTLLGSLMGTQMIYDYVQRRHQDFPTLYLQEAIKYVGNWSLFLRYLQSLEDKGLESGAQMYTIDFWQVIHQNYTSTFS